MPSSFLVKYKCGYCYGELYFNEEKIKKAFCPYCGRKGNWFLAAFNKIIIEDKGEKE